MYSINPATEEILQQYTEHDWPELDARCRRAAAAFASWSSTPIERRAAMMNQLASILRSRRDKLAGLMTREVGKTITASEAEVDKCAAACEFFAQNAGKFLAAREVASDAGASYVRFDPLGVVLAIMPWNFPLWQVFRFAVPALMAGNVGLLKHAPNVPGCALAIEKAFNDAGFPPSVMTTLLAADNSTAERIVTHPAVAAVTLTGSERAGAAVAAAAGKSLKKTVMELGGSDAFIVLADADVSAAAKKAAEARCINNGQSCIAAKRFIVEESIAGEFTRAMIDAMANMIVGDPMHRQTQIGPLARLDLLESLDQQVQASIAAGARLELGGHRMPRVGFFYSPTVLTRVQPGMPAFDEETFGPAAAIITASNPRDAVELANRSKYGLGASIWSKDIPRAQAMAGEIQSGCVFINGIVKSDSRLPFGGIKNSGWGRELSEFGIREFVNVKTVWVNTREY